MKNGTLDKRERKRGRERETRGGKGRMLLLVARQGFQKATKASVAQCHPIEPLTERWGEGTKWWRRDRFDAAGWPPWPSDGRKYVSEAAVAKQGRPPLLLVSAF